jgi:hypothetical protein
MAFQAHHERSSEYEAYGKYVMHCSCGERFSGRDREGALVKWAVHMALASFPGPILDCEKAGSCSRPDPLCVLGLHIKNHARDCHIGCTAPAAQRPRWP